MRCSRPLRRISQIDPATKEVLSYREALWKGFNDLRQKPVLSTNLFVSIVQTIKQKFGNPFWIYKRSLISHRIKCLRTLKFIVFYRLNF